jgi:hypothetical protein
MPITKKVIPIGKYVLPSGDSERREKVIPRIRKTLIVGEKDFLLFFTFFFI